MIFTAPSKSLSCTTTTSNPWSAIFLIASVSVCVTTAETVMRATGLFFFIVVVLVVVDLSGAAFFFVSDHGLGVIATEIHLNPVDQQVRPDQPFLELLAALVAHVRIVPALFASVRGNDEGLAPVDDL